METGIIIAGTFFDMMEEFYRRTGKSVIDIPLTQEPSFSNPVIKNVSFQFCKKSEKYERVDMQGIIAWRLQV